MKKWNFFDVVRDFGEGNTEQEAEAVIVCTQWVINNLHYRRDLQSSIFSRNSKDKLQ